MPGLIRRTGTAQQTPGSLADSADQASSVYKDVYGEMPIPATQFATSVAALKSDYTPSVRTVASDSSMVTRADRKDGMVATGGRQLYQTVTPQVMDPPDSSKFQTYLYGPQVNYSQNTKWYIAYPAATVMNGGKHNLAWSEKTPQLPTRTTGGPGPAAMRPAPRFKAVQTVPRYSTMPPTYPTASTKG